MTGYVSNIEEKTMSNSYFREVLYTDPRLQLVVMSLKPMEEIGMEVHETTDQFFRVESGSGKVVMNGEETEIKVGDAIIIPAGTLHNVINTSADSDLKVYTLYTPPTHKPGTVHKTKEEALAGEE